MKVEKGDNRFFENSESYKIFFEKELDMFFCK